MSKQRKNYTAAFKAKAALAAIKGQQTINEIASSFSVHPNQVTQWRKQALEAIPDSFSQHRVRDASSDEELRAQLYQQIGQLKVELDWVKKKAGLVA
jgi:putative transposase